MRYHFFLYHGWFFQNLGKEAVRTFMHSTVHSRYTINRSSRRKRGMASNPLFIVPDFFCIFSNDFAMATLGLKEMGKFLREGREKSLPCWLSQFSVKMQKKKVWCYEKWVGRHASFPPRRSVNKLPLNPNWHELRKQEKCSSLVPPRSFIRPNELERVSN